MIAQQPRSSCHHHYPRLVSTMCLECGEMLAHEEVQPSETGSETETQWVSWRVGEKEA